MIEARARYVVTPRGFSGPSPAPIRRCTKSCAGDLVLCDGKPLVWASQWREFAAGPRGGFRSGSALSSGPPSVAGKFSCSVGARAPGRGRPPDRAGASDAPPVAHYSPPLRALAQMNHAEIVARCRARNPISCSSLRLPEQEKWISNTIARLACRDDWRGWHRGFSRRAAAARSGMDRRTGTEWVFRLLQEPRRLFSATRPCGAFGPALIGQLWHFSLRAAGRSLVDRGVVRDDVLWA